MGNCRSKTYAAFDDDKRPDGDEDKRPLENVNSAEDDYRELEYEGYGEESSPELTLDQNLIQSSDDSKEYEDYFHIDDESVLENYDEWDIIEFESDETLIVNESLEIVEGAPPLENIPSEEVDASQFSNQTSLGKEKSSTDSPPLQPSLKRQPSSVRFSVSEPLYTVFEDQEDTNSKVYDSYGVHQIGESAQWRKEPHTGSLQSFMSDVSTISTAANFDPIFGDHLLTARIQVILNYNLKSWLLRVGVKQIECHLDPMFENQRVYWQVHLTLMPFKRKRLKTKYKRSSNPIFNQAFEMKNLGKFALDQMSVRYRVYGRFGLAGRKRLAGEVEVKLADLMKRPHNLISEWRELFTGGNGTIRE